MYTNLKPYNPCLYAPSKKPLAVGDLVILLENPRGFCAEIVQLNPSSVIVRFLDSDISSTRMFLKNEVIQTGKTPYDLISQYLPTAVELANALTKERSMPDFGRVKSKTKGGKKPKAPKDLTPEQKKVLARLVMMKLKELKKGDLT